MKFRKLKHIGAGSLGLFIKIFLVMLFLKAVKNPVF